MTEARLPLEGLRVLDFTRVLAGPYATAMLADLGADVIKVEPPGGDDYRHIGPFRGNESALFQTVNRGKRSVVLNLREPDDLALARRLAMRADVLVENFRPGVMARLGLDAATLQADNPGLVFASISGFGQAGPMAALPAYDIIIQALSGIMAQTGEGDGPPTMVGEAIGDVAGGLFAAFGIMVALHERTRTGRGRVIDLALLDALLSMMPTLGARVLVSDQTPVRTGNIHALSAPFGVYPAADSHFAVAVLNDKLFSGFCAAIGRPELAEDPRFSSDAQRRAHEPALAEAIAGWATGLPVASAVAALTEAGVPAAALQDARAAWTSDQARARGLVGEVTHPILGNLAMPCQPVRFQGMTTGPRRPAPGLDEHGDEIRAWMEKER